MAFLDRIFKRRKPAPKGVSGAVLNFSYLNDTFDADFDLEERNPELIGRKKYEKYANMLANVTVIAASVRYFLNLTARSHWSFKPVDTASEEARRYADLATEIILHDPITSWHRVVRRMALYRFFGFSMQEYTVYRRPDGVISVYDIFNRPQSTIAEWVFDSTTKELREVRQEDPVSSQVYVIPRRKLLYIVDDTISDSPAGLGLLRHIVSASDALKRYEQLEGIGFETDLRGIPIGRAPLSALNQLVKSGQMTRAQATQALGPIKTFLQNHVKSPKLSMLLDSHVYHAQDEAQRPSPQKQWDVELLKAASTSLEPVARTIQRLNREIARVLGTEQLMLGEDIAGSFALSKDKTQSFVLLVEGALKEMRTIAKRDLLTPVWELNGWPIEMMPEPATESVNYKDVEEVARTLQYIALAGVPVHPDDPALQELRDITGLSRTPPEITARLLEMLELEKEAMEAKIESAKNPPGQSGRTGTGGANLN